jgi:hypothetical protein
MTSLPGESFVSIKFQLDSAATCNTISASDFYSIKGAKMTKSQHRLYPYGNLKPIIPVGITELLCERKKISITLLTYRC